jgi:hypothetical protein
MLNSLDESEYDWVRKSLITQFANKRTSPSEKDIIKVINSAGYKKCHIQNDLVNTLKLVKDAKKSECSNCGNSHHSYYSCWQKGGGAAGKALDWWKEAQEKKNGKGKTKPSDKANTAKDSNSEDSHVETMNLSIDSHFLRDCFTDSYMSCTTINTPHVSSPPSE